MDSSIHLYKDRKDVLMILISSGVSIQKTDLGKIFIEDYVLSKFNEPIISFLINEGVSVNAVKIDMYHNTALMTAARFGLENIMRLLIKNGADVNVNCGDTPLSDAISSSKVGAVKILIDSGANIETTDFNWKTPLMQASRSGLSDVVEILIDAGAELEKKDFNGMTALVNAAFSMNWGCLEILLERGADIEARDKDGKTALMHASRNGSKESVEILLKHGADVNAKDNKGWTALIFASSVIQYHAVIKMLKDAGAKE